MSDQPDEKSMLDVEGGTEGASIDADEGNEGAQNDPKPGNHPKDRKKGDPEDPGYQQEDHRDAGGPQR
jgi:hypothetical protein